MTAAFSGVRANPLALLERAKRLVRWLVDPLLRFNVIDRSLALGAQAFGALIPLLILLQAAQPGMRTMATYLIERFDRRRRGCWHGSSRPRAGACARR
jgi:hypothetical protein